MGMTRQTVSSIGTCQNPVFPGTVSEPSGSSLIALVNPLQPPIETTIATPASSIPLQSNTHCSASVQATLRMPPIMM